MEVEQQYGHLDRGPGVARVRLVLTASYGEDRPSGIEEMAEVTVDDCAADNDLIAFTVTSPAGAVA